MTAEQAAAILGPDACAESDRLAAQAPPLTEGQHADLAVILRRRPESDDRNGSAVA